MTGPLLAKRGLSRTSRNTGPRPQFEDKSKNIAWAHWAYAEQETVDFFDRDDGIQALGTKSPDQPMRPGKQAGSWENLIIFAGTQTLIASFDVAQVGRQSDRWRTLSPETNIWATSSSW